MERIAERNMQPEGKHRQPIVEGRIPGYQGYIPGKDQVYGRRFAESTTKAFEYTQRQRLGEQPFHLPHLVETARPEHLALPEAKKEAYPPMVQSKTEGRIPGYCGYVPGMKNHIWGQRYTDGTREAVTQTQKILNCGTRGAPHQPTSKRFEQSEPIDYLIPKGAFTLKRTTKEEIHGVSTGHIPGYDGFVAGVENHTCGTRYAEATVKGKECLAMQRQEKRPYGEQPSLVDAPRPNQSHVPNNSHLSDRCIPGYQGYIPAMNNHSFGARYTEVSHNAAKMAKAGTCHLEGTSLPPEEFLTSGKGCIPGYQGYIPGLNNHVYGTRYSQATSQAADIRRTLAKDDGSILRDSASLMSSSNGRSPSKQK